GGAADGDGALVFVHDLFRDGQAQAGAAVALGGVEQLEHVLHHGGGDAGAVVDHFEDGLAVLRVIAAGDGDQAVVRLDRVQRVAQQVHEDLVHARGVERDGGLGLVYVGDDHRA